MGLSRELVFKLAKGFRGRSKNCWRLARLRVEKALTRSFEGRKLKKREHRGIWIVRINAGAREHGVKYGQFMNGLSESNITLNRKILSELAAKEPYSFKALVDQVKFMKGAS